MTKLLKNDQIEATFQAQGIQSAAEKLDVLKLSKEKRAEYESYQQDLHYQASMAMPYDIGKAEGKAEVARNLLRQGIPIESIASATGLTSVTIRALLD